MRKALGARSRKALIIPVLTIAFGAVTYLAVRMVIDQDIDESSMGSNIGLGLIGLAGEVIFWTGVVVLAIVVIMRFKKGKRR